MTMDSDRIAELKQRIAALDRLLAHYPPPNPAEHVSETTADEAEFWASRLEERQLLQARLDSMLERKAG